MNEKLTPYPELDKLLLHHAKSLQKTLGSIFVGYYLQGSLAIGDFDMTSDVDFVIVTQDELTSSQVDAVQLIHTQTYAQDIRWAKHLEYSFFPIALMQKPSPMFPKASEKQQQFRELWYFDHGSQKIERSDHCNSLVTRWSVREKGIAVLGPNPKTFLPPILPNELRQEIKDTILDWGEAVLEDPVPYMNRFYQAYLVLNYARMLQDLHEGRITSKLEGAEWAKLCLDSKWKSLIEFCWKERQDTEISIHQAANPEKYAQVLKFVSNVMDEAAKYKINN